MMESDIPYEERELIQRAINSVSGEHKHACYEGVAVPMPRWAIVKKLFCCGSTVARAICTRYGYEPEKYIGALSRPISKMRVGSDYDEGEPE